MRIMRGTYANQVGTDSSLREGVGENMHGNPDKNLRSDIMHRIRQRSESAMTVCRGSLIAKLYGDLGVENKTIILLFLLSSHSDIA